MRFWSSGGRCRRQARRIWPPVPPEALAGSAQLFLSDLVVAECVYVLESFYEVDRSRVAEPDARGDRFSIGALLGMIDVVTGGAV